MESAVYQFCDACKGRIHSKIAVINVDFGELIRLSSGREHLRSDMKSRLHVLCPSCGTRAADVLLRVVRDGGVLAPSP